jgi:hypothetical protein
MMTIRAGDVVGHWVRRMALFGFMGALAWMMPGGVTAASGVALKEGEIPRAPAKVELRQDGDGNWRFYVNGEVFPVRGAGGATAPGLLEQLKLAGGNCVRTWGIGTLDEKVSDGERFIDRAWRLGIMVVPGIWVQHERHGFDYANSEAVRQQREETVAAVRRYKDHPAVLAWGLGNEMEGVSAKDASVAVLKEVNELAKLVKAEDPAHPVMTVIAFNPGKAVQVMEHCPEIDILGVNTYGAAAGAGTALKGVGWRKPFAVTEFGVKGFWEVATTPWGAPYEQTSQEKAANYFAAHRLVFEVNDGKELCLGTFAFLWGWKQERTATWFGMFLPTLEKLPQVDAMTRAWLGRWPENRCPKIGALTSLAYGQAVSPGTTVSARVEVEDPEGDPLTYAWELLSEATDLRHGGEAEAAPLVHSGLIRRGDAAECLFVTPEQPGNYRLFVVVRDGRGAAATANVPFQVR